MRAMEWLGLLVAAALLALWVGATRRQATTQARHTEWADAPGKPELWTSAARCPRCRAEGCLLSEQHGELWHTCMACGHRHPRATKA